MRGKKLPIWKWQVKYVLLSVLSNADDDGGGEGDKFDQRRLKRLQGSGEPSRQLLPTMFISLPSNYYESGTP